MKVTYYTILHMEHSLSHLPDFDTLEESLKWGQDLLGENIYEGQLVWYVVDNFGNKYA